MRISIVTLSYNQRAFLREAIDSVLQQDRSDVEYLVVDPGSMDGSRELIRSYGDRISQVIFEPDRGAADGLNKGFGRATGEIFGFLNADDYLLPGALGRVAEFFDLHPQYDMVMGNGYIVNSHGDHLRHVEARDFTVRRYLHGGTSWLQQATFFRREKFLRSPRFNPSNRTSWDGELFVLMANMGAKIGYLSDDLGAFRTHDDSISGSGRLNDAYLADCRRIFRQIRGREWRSTDELLRFFFRVEGRLLRAGLWPRTRAEESDVS